MPRRVIEEPKQTKDEIVYEREVKAQGNGAIIIFLKEYIGEKVKIVVQRKKK